MDAPARPWPPSLGTYAEERELFQLLQHMLEELLIHKPDDPIQFMIDHLKQNKDDAPRICVLGPPASGKTTVALWLCKCLDAVRISQETLLFKEILAVTKEAKAYKERKERIPNALWANLIQERLSNVDCIKQPGMGLRGALHLALKQQQNAVFTAVFTWGRIEVCS